jgi:REP element-mobilizing transposase RayT
MPDKYQNKYRIPSARLQTWDYGRDAAYFVTICTKNREHFFGEIVDSVVETQCIASLQPTTIGKMVEQEWIKTPELRPDMNLELGEFVLMPNHFHGIMIIGKNKYNTLPLPSLNNANQFGPQSKNLGSIIRGFKSSVTTQAKKTGNVNFAWQSRFHDHIIRDAKSFERIQNYIINNILNWKDDKFFS